MGERRGGVWAQAQVTGQALAQALVVIAALGTLGATLAAAAGWLPWPEMSLRWGGAYIPLAGMYAQVGVTVLLSTHDEASLGRLGGRRVALAGGTLAP